MLTYLCPHCGKGCRFRDSAAGKVGRCPGCKKAFALEEEVPVAAPTARMARKTTPRGRGVGFWLILALSLAAGAMALTVCLVLYLHHVAQVEDLDERYERLAADYREHSDQFNRLSERYQAANTDAERDRILNEINDVNIHLTVLRPELEALLRDRMAIGGVRPGDNQKLDAIRQARSAP